MNLILLLTIFWINIIPPNNIDPPTAEAAIQKAESSFKEQNFDESILWYHYALYELQNGEETSLKAYLHYKLADVYETTNAHRESSYHMQQTLSLNANNEINSVLRYHLGLSLILNENFAGGELQLLRARMAVDDPAIKLHITLMLARLQGLLSNKDQMIYYIDQAKNLNIEDSEEITSLLRKVNFQIQKEVEQKSSSKAKMLSSFLPGSGQLYAHSYKNAFGALFVNTLTTGLIIRSVKLERYHHASLIGLLLWWRYYDGNRDNAAHSANSYNLSKETKAIHQANETLTKIYQEPFMQKDMSLSRKHFEE
ncbi:MAG: hypothetical protein WD098_00110 [Balneolales bacterium]